MKKLFIVRHAKSSWDNSSLRDIDRPLNERGLRDAPMMANVFANQYESIDCLISSKATRAYTTASIFAERLKVDINSIQLDESIYGASAASMLELINSIDNKLESACVFGHNPTFTYFAEKLADIQIGNLPTCGIVGIEFGVNDWAAVSFGSGVNFYFDYPKKHL